MLYWVPHECSVLCMKHWRRQTEITARGPYLPLWEREKGTCGLSDGGGGWRTGKSALAFGLASHVPLMVYTWKRVVLAFWVILGISKAFHNICEFCLTLDLGTDFLMWFIPTFPPSQVRKLCQREGFPPSLCMRGRVSENWAHTFVTCNQGFILFSLISVTPRWRKEAQKLGKMRRLDGWIGVVDSLWVCGGPGPPLPPLGLGWRRLFGNL